MAKIYRTTDRLAVKLGELTVTISPMTRYEKADVQGDIMQGKILEATGKAIQYSVKNIKGVELVNGDKYDLAFDDIGKLTDDCVDDLFNMTESEDLQRVCLQLLNGIPDEFTDAETGEKINGVDFIKQEKKPRKKK